jgi:hypothetical protein
MSSARSAVRPRACVRRGSHLENATNGWNGQLFFPLNVGNPNLGPERTSEIELADGSVLTDRLTTQFNWHHRGITDALSTSVRFRRSAFDRTAIAVDGAMAGAHDGNVRASPQLRVDRRRVRYTNTNEVTLPAARRISRSPPTRGS